MKFKLLLKRILKSWITECKLDNVAYKYNYRTNTLTIYSQYCGILIGKGGETINKYKEELKNITIVTKNLKIEFVEIDGII